MKSKLLMIGAVLLVGIAVLLGLASRQPGAFQISRSARIPAPPATVFGMINDLHRWESWSPWAKLDPAMKVTFDGPPAGVGASYHWVGNSEVGEGRMTIIESRAAEKVGIRLEFMKPIEALNLTEFTLKGQGTETEVTWSMSGTNGFASKLFSVFVDLDKMVGGDFERGLAQLKAAAEEPVAR